MPLKNVISKLFFMSTGVIGAKVISLAVITILVNHYPESASYYFENSIYSGLLGALFLLGVVFGIQIDGIRIGKYQAVLFSFLVVIFMGLSVSIFLGVSIALALSSILSSLVAVLIAYLYRNSKQGHMWQLFFIVIQQPVIFAISAYFDEGSIKFDQFIRQFLSNEVVYLLTAFVLLLYFKVVTSRVSLKSVEVFFVCLMTYLVIVSGLEVSPESSTFYVWLAVQIGGATVFLGNSISYYLMEFYRKSSNGEVAYYYRVYDFFLVVSVVLFAFVMIIDTKYDEFMYGVLLTIQGLGKAASSMILTSNRYWTISIANLLSASFLYMSYIYVLWSDFRTTIIVLISANLISVLWIVATGRLFRHE